jgi:acyl carrier protein
MYATGDIGRRREDGKIEYIGRKDEQVKVRGFRIETGEIESALIQHESIVDAVVVVREDADGDKRLIGYFVQDPQQKIALKELREYLKQQMPLHMVPSVLMPLDALPLTANGKINRQALPAPDLSRSDIEELFVAPRTPLEQALTDIWSEVLQIEQVGIHDNFFALGGHSLKATVVTSRLREIFNIELTVQTIFEMPTVAELSVGVVKALIEQRGGENSLTTSNQLTAIDV